MPVDSRPHTIEDEAALARLIAEGNQDALETVFQAYGGAVKSMAKRVLRDDGLAEDVVQDVFVKFWRNPERFDPARGSLRTFLLTIAHRRAVDTVRAQQARTNREDKVLDDPAPASVEEQVEASDISESVREAVATLSDGERDAISLAYFGGLTYVETARRLGLPEGTVKGRIRSGLRKLGETLAEAAS